MVDEGLLAPEDAARHPKRHIITHALGSHRGISLNIAAHAIEPGDCFMLCTDGLTNMVSEDTIRHILESETPLSACKKLIEAANDAGGTDNVTAVVMRTIPGSHAKKRTASSKRPGAQLFSRDGAG